jgi:sugar lactone lactonase YvrE
MMKLRILLVIWTLSFIGAISAAAGTLYVSDVSTFSVSYFDSTTGAFIGQLNPPGGFGLPAGMAIGPDGYLYVADTYGNSILKFSASTGAYIGPYLTTDLDGPTGLAFGPDGKLYIDNQGTGGFGYTARYDGVTVDQFVPPNTGPPVGGLFYPAGLTFGPDGNLYVADTSTSEIARFNGLTAAFDAYVPAGSIPPAISLSAPSGLQFGADGNLYIADINSGVLRFDGSNLTKYVPDIAGLGQPTNLTFGPDGLLYITDSGRVTHYDGSNLVDFIPAGNPYFFSPAYLAFSNPVPEPSTFVLLAVGMLSVGWIRRFRRLTR